MTGTKIRYRMLTVEPGMSVFTIPRKIRTTHSSERFWRSALKVETKGVGADWADESTFPSCITQISCNSLYLMFFEFADEVTIFMTVLSQPGVISGSLRYPLQ